MLQTLSQFVDITDPSIQQAIKELKMLELDIQQEEMIKIIKETFSCQQQQQIKNQTFQVQVGQQCEINLIEDHYNKPVLCEYLEAQFESLVELTNEIAVMLSEILQTLDQKSLVENKTQLYKFQEEAQKQILLLNQPLQEQKVENSGEIYKNEFIQFVKDQKNLLAHKNQVQQLEKKTMEMRKIIFEKIEEQNNLSEAVSKKMEMNIDNELKLLEKTTELKLIAKIESDLQEEVLKMEKSNANSVFENPGVSTENAESLEKLIAQTFNQICNLCQEMKEQKIKNNDLIYDQILHNVEIQEQTLQKIQQLQESNVHQFLDYINNFPDCQQYFRNDVIDKIREQKKDFQFCQQWKCDSLEQDCQDLDEFLKLQKGCQDMKQNTDELAQNFNSEWMKQYKQLESIKQFLINLQKLI